MGHIHTEPGQHDFTVSAFIIRSMFTTDSTSVHAAQKPHLLLHRHKILNKWMHIGGHIELNEDPWTAVLREIWEESGYIDDQLNLYVPPIPQIVGVYERPREFHPTPVSFNTHSIGLGDHFHTDIVYAFHVNDVVDESLLRDGESREFKWVTLDELLMEKETYRNIIDIGSYVLNGVYDKWIRVNVSQGLGV